MSGISDYLPPVLQNLEKRENVAPALQFLGENGEWIKKNPELAKKCFKQIESHDLFQEPKTWQTYQYLLKHHPTLFPSPQEMDKRHLLHVTLGNVSADIPRNRFAKESQIFQSKIQGKAQVEFNAPELSSVDRQKFIDYFQTGNLAFTRKNVQQILKLADDLAMPQLKEKCLDFLSKNLRVDNNFVTFYEFAQSLKDTELSHKCLHLWSEVLLQGQPERTEEPPNLPPELQNLDKRGVATALAFLRENDKWVRANPELARWCFKQIESHDLSVEADSKIWESYQSLLRRHVDFFPQPAELDKKHVLRVTLGNVTIAISRNRFAKESRVFQRMVRPDMKEGQTGQVALKPDLSQKFHQHFLHYLETGKIALSGDNVLEFLKLTDFYEMPQLRQKCLEYLEGNLQIDDDFLEFLQVAKAIENPQLRSQCLLVGIKILEPGLMRESFNRKKDPAIAQLEEQIKEDATLKGLLELAKAAHEWGWKFHLEKPTEDGVVPIIVDENVTNRIRDFSPAHQFPFPVSLKLKYNIFPTDLNKMQFPPEIHALKIYCQFHPPAAEFEFVKKLTSLQDYENTGATLRNFEEAKAYLSAFPLPQALKRVNFQIHNLNDEQLEELIKLVPHATTLTIEGATISKIPNAAQFREIALTDCSISELNLTETKVVTLENCENITSLKMPNGGFVKAWHCPNLETIEGPEVGLNIAECPKLKK